MSRHYRHRMWALVSGAYYHLVSVSMLLVRQEILQYKKLACAYGTLKVDDLHRTIIHLLCVVCTYHNNAVEFSGTVAIPISPFGGD